MLRTAAADPATDRIFVNKWIKRRLCDAAGTDQAWLRRLVPWFGHDEHFHVRLVCPPDSQQCQPQAPVPHGDGCGAALADWFKPPASPPTPPPAWRPPNPPAACAALWRAP